MTSSGDRQYSAVDALEFIGERDKPLRPDEIVARRPIFSRGEPPEALLSLNQRYSLFLATNSEIEPEISISRVGQTEQPAWRVDVMLASTQQFVGMPGRSALRQAPEVFLSAIDRSVGFAGYRPEWMDLFHIPRLLPGQGYREMRRINGRPVKPFYVFGADDRQIFRDSSYPWGCIGRIFTNEGKSGTGTLVGRNLVVTAGHLVPWSSSSWWMRFVPAYYDGLSLHGSGVESYVSDVRGYDVGGDVTGYDWAILKLYNPLGDWLGYLGSNSYSDDWEDEPYWTVVGYPGAIAGARRPSYQGGVSVFDDDSDSNGGKELETRADMTPGNSGGPMFAWWNKDPRLIGVVSGEEEDWIFPFSSEKGNVVAGGSGFGNLIRWGRTNW